MNGTKALSLSSVEITEFGPVDESIVNISISSDHQIKLIKTVNHNGSWDLPHSSGSLTRNYPYVNSFGSSPDAKDPRAKDRFKAGL